MSEWRDRGYVPDSDEEDIALDSPDTPKPQPRTLSTAPDGDIHYEKSFDADIRPEELQKDINPSIHLVSHAASPEREEYNHPSTATPDVRDNLSQEIGEEFALVENTTVDTEENSHRQSSSRYAPNDLDTSRPPQLEPSKGQPIVLITQTRRAQSPPEASSKHVKTYSRKFQPTTQRRATNVVSPDVAISDNAGQMQEQEEHDDEFMDIDALVGDDAEPAQPHSSQQHSVTDFRTERRSSVSSSDLSDVDMQILSSSQPFFPEYTSTAHPSNARQIDQNSTASPLVENSLSDRNLATFAAPTRNFRTRKAIQLHPYMIEIEQYRRSLKARGVRPIQVATHSQPPRDRAESEDAEFRQEETQSQDRHVSHTQETTPPRSSLSSQEPQRSNLKDLIADNDEEFPDFDAAIRRNVIGGIQEGFKRRKTLETPHRHGNLQTLPSSKSNARGKLKSLNLTRRSSRVGNQVLLPPSPPKTSSPSTLEPVSAAPSGFRLPRGLTPATVPTPLPSSPERFGPASTRRPRQVVISSDDDNEDQNTNASDQNSSADSDAQERQFMRRRMRGVLPASYLKLNGRPRQASPIAERNAAHNASSKPIGPVKGVAQRKNTSSSAIPARQNSFIFFSDNSDSESSLQELPAPHFTQTRLPSPTEKFLPGQHRDITEVEEHDEIDAMFPSTGQTRFRQPGSKKRQSRLTDVFSKESGQAQTARQTRPHVISGPSTRKPSSKAKHGSKPKKKSGTKKATQLSILDATANTSSAPAPVRPQFVRLAARQARKRHDYGRHSPTNKDIRLATREDTQDAMEPLTSWRSGHLRKNWKPPAPQTAQFPSNVHASSASGRSEVSDTRRLPSTELRKPLSSNRPRLASGSGLVQTESAEEGGSREPRRNARNRSQSSLRRQLERNHRMRPAQLETVAPTNSRDLDTLTFAPPPSRLMEIFNRDRGAPPASRLRLERFLQDKGDMPSVNPADPADDGRSTDLGDNAVTAVHPRSRKRLAQRFDVETARFRQPDEPLPADTPLVENAEPTNVTSEVEIMQGLDPFGTRYPTDFDIRPLEMGTFFAASTFVGSGDFDDSLTLRKRDLDTPAGRITVEVGGHSLCWSAWNEDVSTGLGAILSACSEDLHSAHDLDGDTAQQEAIQDVSARFHYFLRSTVRYMSGCLYFLDPIDRPVGLTRISRFVDDFADMVEAEVLALRMRANIQKHLDTLLLDSLLFLMCITGQLVQISNHPSVEPQVQGLLKEKAVRLSRRIVVAALPERFVPIRDFLEEHRKHSLRDSGIQEHDVAVKTIVIVNHVLRSIDVPSKLSDILTTHLSHSVSKMSNIHALDQIWYDIFAVQPLLELDARGIFRPRNRFQTTNDAWPLIKSLLQRVFDLYPATSKAKISTVNDYVRACLTRVYHLIARWGWRKCEIALNTIYDFFAKHHLSQLHREEGKGSPTFLENLDQNPPVELDKSDCAFHIFLKLLVIGLRKMQEVYAKNKIRGFAWRFIPNHGRTYQKDQELTHVALDALRNHHDLLCTLYWVLPAGSGPRLQMIRDLVDHDNSHREACRLGVHAWGILARYQLSQAEQFDDSDVLAFWFKDMVSSSISQYRLARSEAEAQYAVERSNGSIDISSELLETTITTNQRSIFATLQDLLHAMRQVIRVSKSWVSVRSLFEQSNVIDVLKIFDINQPRLSLAIKQTLEIIEELLAAKSRLFTQSAQESQQGSDDSQEYGDWSFMDQVMESEVETSRPRTSDLGFLQEPLANLVSTCFGSEISPDDELLKKLVDIWVATAGQYVKDQTHDWSNFLDVYSSTSWFQLRDTDQRHKYTCYFLASIIKSDKSSLHEHRSMFMKAWFISLLERESTLKFQHVLTSSLLEQATQEPLLHNLPFAADHQTGKYHISLADIRERRVSLIGSILANIHSSLGSALYSGVSAVSVLRQEYVDMLKQAMQYMRRTYEDLQDMSGRLGSSHLGVKGAYVSFVQHVISLMQQYTSDICPIDKFFIDSTAFPLPADDPTYVIGRLKSYMQKLSDTRARKQLTVFVQTVSERAAIDDQQPYLVSQLHQALSGEPSRSLRNVLMSAVIPAYVSCAMSTSCGWIVALPVVEASSLVLEDLIFDLDLADEASVDTDFLSITSLLRSIHTWTVAQMHDSGSLLQKPGHLQFMAAIFGAVEASLTLVDYVHRATGKGTDAVSLVRSFAEIGEYLTSLITFAALDIQDNLDTPFPPDIPQLREDTCLWQDTLKFCTRNLQDALSSNWTYRDGSCFVTQNNNVREVEIGVGGVVEERLRLQAGIEMFRRSFDVVMCGNRSGEDVERTSDVLALLEL